MSKNYLNDMKNMKLDLIYALNELEKCIYITKKYSDYWNITSNIMKNLSRKYLNLVEIWNWTQMIY